jgi:hypothetical protein
MADRHLLVHWQEHWTANYAQGELNRAADEGYTLVATIMHKEAPYFVLVARD